MRSSASDRTEDLLLGHGHLGRDRVQDRGAQEEALTGVLRAAIYEHLCPSSPRGRSSPRSAPRRGGRHRGHGGIRVAAAVPGRAPGAPPGRAWPGVPRARPPRRRPRPPRSPRGTAPRRSRTPTSTGGTAASRLASGITTRWFLAPASACTRFPRSPARRETPATGSDPTKDTARTEGWSISALTASSRRGRRSARRPGRRPRERSLSRFAVSGVRGDGFSTIALPAVMASGANQSGIIPGS